MVLRAALGWEGCRPSAVAFKSAFLGQSLPRCFCQGVSYSPGSRVLLLEEGDAGLDPGTKVEGWIFCMLGEWASCWMQG